jgi:hypothetical protein
MKAADTATVVSRVAHMKHAICKALTAGFIFLFLLTGTEAPAEKTDNAPVVTLYFFGEKGAPTVPVPSRFSKSWSGNTRHCG